MKNSTDIRYRVYLTFIAMCVFAIAIIYKGATIQFKEGKELLSQADSMHTKIQVIDPERGNIYSEDGSLLSTSIPQFDLRIDFKAIAKDTFNKYIEPLSKDLAALFNNYTWTEYKEILSNEYKKENRYYLLKKRASYEEYLSVKKMQPFSKNQNKGGLIEEPSTKRINPYGLLANRVIGLWRKNANNVGIEGKYDSLLRGRQGQRIVRRIAGGAWMPLDGSEVEPENGADVYTTIDLQIQDVVENALYAQVEKEEAVFGTCIVMEVKTGKIKAMANLGRLSDGTYGEDFNYALKKIEPGSTFKLVSLISLMRDHLVTIDDKVNCQGGSAKFGPYTIRDSHAGLGWLTIKDAFAHSSNVAFAKLIHENYKDKIGTYWSNLHALGLDMITGLNISDEPRPYFKRDSVEKGRYSLAYMGMGYSVMITPLHTCMVYNSIANNGKLMKPYLVNSVKEYGNNVMSFEPVILKDSLLDANAIEKIKETMNEVIESGTGKSLKNPYYTICGKTGTAQVADVIEKIGPNGEIIKEKIRYTDRMYHGSFVGFFPKEDPQYTICVVLRTKKGSNNYYGGQIAWPVFKEVANRLYAMNMHKVNSVADQEKIEVALVPKNMKAADFNKIALGLKLPTTVQTNDKWVLQQKDSTGKYMNQVISISNNAVPNVQGMGLKDALYLLEKSGLRVTCLGKGKVVSQSVAPGSPVQKGSKIMLQLS
ncbi:MAG: transpeptidase family protein [Bacteroidetes bacterium]|nr:transpeptidase family protein [Bacteroidota bacterium]